MMQILRHIPIFISGIISGIMVYQSMVIAPSINKLLSSQSASLYLRHIWPNFFLLIAFLSVVSGIIILAYCRNQKMGKIISFVSFTLMTLCYLLIPLMNEAKDSNEQNTFIFLHLSSMIITLITLLMNISLIAFWRFKT